MDWTGILIGAAIGNVIGGAITIAVSWFFYVRAARGLQREAEELKQQTQLIMRGLEEAAQEGLIKFNRNKHTGELEGIEFKARAHIGSSSASATATVRKENDDPADQAQRMQGNE